MRIAVIGLGRMGSPIARRLSRQHDVRGWDVAEPAAPVAPVRLAEGPISAVDGVDALVTVLPGPRELGQALGDGTAFSCLAAGALWVDLTSADSDTGARLHALAAASGVASVAAPMTGGPSDAERGSLGFLVGGAPVARDAASPLLAELGDPGRVQVVGDDPAAAYLTKLLGNLLWFGQVVAVTEVLALAQGSGLAAEATARILADGPGASTFLQRDAEHLLRGDPMATFGIDRVVEELHAVEAVAERLSSPFELSGLVTRIHEAALERYGPRPGELLASLLLQERAGIRLSPPDRPHDAASIPAPRQPADHGA